MNYPNAVHDRYPFFSLTYNLLCLMLYRWGPDDFSSLNKDVHDPPLRLFPSTLCSGGKEKARKQAAVQLKKIPKQ